MTKQILNIQNAIKDLTTIRDFIRWAVTHFNQNELFYGHGTDNSWDEAVFLILGALNLPIDSDQRIIDAKLTIDERELLSSLIEKRIVNRIPVPYLINEAWFCELNFYVDERVLIPRSPIAELIDKEFQPWIGSHKVNKILDLCTGSGCIAIAAAMTFLDAQVDAVDISKDALKVAEHNVHKHNLEDNVKLICSDLFNDVKNTKYDIIISNPPYVRTKEFEELPEEYKHEPGLALEAGNDGLNIVRRILSEAQKHLNENGILIVEVGLTQEEVEKTFPNVPFTWIDFEIGGEGVFILTFEELEKYKNNFL